MTIIKPVSFFIYCHFPKSKVIITRKYYLIIMIKKGQNIKSSVDDFLYDVKTIR